LLAESSNKIETVAKMCGYQSINSFALPSSAQPECRPNAIGKTFHIKTGGKSALRRNPLLE
jgi:transcriptional regulator GlxA family with amidase domain